MTEEEATAEERERSEKAARRERIREVRDKRRSRSATLRERRKRRIQIEVSPEVFQDLQEMAASSGSTMTGVFRSALKVYKLIVEEEKQNSKFIIESKEGRKQLLVP